MTIRSDYATKKWSLFLNSVQVAEGLSFYTQTISTFTGFKVSGAGSSSMALDELTIGLLKPWPSKGTLIRFQF